MLSLPASLLRHRILIAASGIGVAALGCAERGKPQPTASPKPPGPTKTQPATSTPAISAQAKPTPPPSATPSANGCDMEGPIGRVCYTPRSAMAAMGTGNPAPKPPPSSYDANGCLPQDEVTNGCCNPAKNGPKFEKGECCYEFCPGACCGRPFVVEGAPRVAELAAGNAWTHETAKTSLSPATLSSSNANLPAAEAWLKDALMEHASIASFARFALELLAVGAPSDLVGEATQAITDEVEHARLCFAVASRLGASGVTPGPLPMDHALVPRGLAAVAASAVVEGCVGETVAALVAAEQRERTSDRTIRNVLEKIAEDEARHAELAWRFVAWAVAVGGVDVAAAVREAFDGSLAALLGSGPAAGLAVDSEKAWHDAGRLTEVELARVRASAVRDVLEPAVAVLLPFRGRSSHNRP